MSPADTPQLFNFVNVWKDNVGWLRSFQIVNDGQHLSKIAHTADDPKDQASVWFCEWLRFILASRQSASRTATGRTGNAPLDQK